MKMLEDEHIENIEKQEKLLSGIKEVAKTHQVISEEVALLVNMKDKLIPEMIEKVQELVGNIEGGFNVEELNKQVRNVLNDVINKSDYTKLRNNVENAAKSLQESVNRSISTSEMWSARFESYKADGKMNTILMSVGFGILVGFSGACFLIRQVVHLFM